MREILFRGKRKGDEEWEQEWILGDLMQIPTHNFCSIIEQTACAENWEVIPETVGQYTGLTDKNGNKIWENDICDRKEPFPEIVKMQKGDWILDYSYAVGRENCYCNLGFYVCERNSVEVIGNIFDNVELLEASCTNSRTGN